MTSSNSFIRDLAVESLSGNFSKLLSIVGINRKAIQDNWTNQETLNSKSSELSQSMIIIFIKM